MKKNQALTQAIIVFGILMVGLLAHAAETLAPLDSFSTPTATDFGQFIVSLGTMGSMGVMGISMLVVQGLFLIIRTRFGNLLGIHKMAVLAALSFLVTAGTKLLGGGSLWSLFTDWNTLMAYQVCYHQWIKHIQEQKDAKEGNL